VVEDPKRNFAIATIWHECGIHGRKTAKIDRDKPAPHEKRKLRPARPRHMPKKRLMKTSIGSITARPPNFGTSR
jgi:hypothetical protein